MIPFREVPVGATFGKGDYFHYKNSPVTAVMEVSGEQNEWGQEDMVILSPSNEDHLTTRQEMVDQGWNLDIELPDDEDWLSGKTCNPDAPEECESCQ